MTSPSPSQRLADVLGGPALARLRARLRARLERGVALTGRLTLQGPSPEERTAVERLFGRLGRGQALHVDLQELAALLRAAELSDDLAAAIVSLEGQIENRRARVMEAAARFGQVIAAAREALSDALHWSGWLDDIEASGLLRRLAGSDPDEAEALLAGALAVLQRIPAAAVPLAELAAAAVGDSHALDIGEPIGTLVLRAIALRAGFASPTDTDQRRSAWASVGVLCDELSAPLLVLNLPARTSNPCGRALSLAAETGEPCRLHTRQILRDPPTFAFAAGTRVFVCENATVVAAVADRLGSRSRTLLATEGQPKTALRLLLAKLREAGAVLAYHGDFDWPGIQIANGLITQFGVVPWRLRAVDYLQAAPGARLVGGVVTPLWEPALGEAMHDRGRLVHEEAVIDALIGDLDSDHPLA